MAYDDDKQENFMDQLHKSLEQAHAEAVKEAAREPIGEYEIPPEHVERVYELWQRVADAEHPKDQRCNSDMWDYIASFMPATADYKCRIFTHDIMRPTVRLIAPLLCPRVGVDDVVEVHEITGEDYRRYQDVSDERHTKIGAYRLAVFLRKHIPNIDTSKNWCTFAGRGRVILFRKNE